MTEVNTVCIIMTGMLRKILLVIFSLWLASCAASPASWLVVKEDLLYDNNDPNIPDAIKQGKLDGCNSALKMHKNPSLIKDSSHFAMSGNYAEDPDYRAAWTDAFRYCAMRSGTGIGMPFLRSIDMLAPRGDAFCFKRVC